MAQPDPGDQRAPPPGRSVERGEDVVDRGPRAGSGDGVARQREAAVDVPQSRMARQREQIGCRIASNFRLQQREQAGRVRLVAAGAQQVPVGGEEKAVGQREQGEPRERVRARDQALAAPAEPAPRPPVAEPASLEEVFPVGVRRGVVRPVLAEGGAGRSRLAVGGARDSGSPTPGARSPRRSRCRARSNRESRSGGRTRCGRASPRRPVPAARRAAPPPPCRYPPGHSRAALRGSWGPGSCRHRPARRTASSPAPPPRSWRGRRATGAR